MVTSRRVVGMPVFVYNWYGWYFVRGLGRPSISSLMIEHGRVVG